LKGIANLYVTNGEIGVQRSLVQTLRQVEGVEHAQPLVVERIIIPKLNDNMRDRVAVMLGIEVNDQVISENRFGVKITMTLDTSKFPRKIRPPVFISRNLFDERQAGGVPDDEIIPIRIAGKVREFLPVGVLDLEGPAESLGKNVVAMEIEQACGAIGRVDRVSRIDVLFRSDADPERVKSLVEAVVGNQAQVRTLEMQGQSTQEVIGGIQIALSLCAVGAIVVGLFLVYNALSVSVTERRHDIGVMRSLGATRGQIAGLFSGEAIFLGLIGAIFGVPLGVGLAELAILQIEDVASAMFINDEIKLDRWNPVLMLTAMGAGMLTALIAALIPSIKAASDEPADAVRRAPSSGGRLFRRLHRLGCLALVGGGILSIVFRDYLPPRVGMYGGMVLTLTGFLLAMPLIVTALAKLFLPLTRTIFGIEARLAADNLLRAPGRTGVVIGAFGAGVALMFQIAGVGRSDEEPVLAWLDRAVTADLFMFSGNLATANSSSSPMEASIAPELQAEVKDVESTVGIRYCRVEYNRTVVMVIGLDAINYHTMTTTRHENTSSDLDRFLKLPQPNTCVISDNFAQKHAVQEGDTLTLPGPTGPVKLLVLGTIQDYSWSKGTILMDRAVYAKLFRDPLVDFYHVFLKSGTAEEKKAMRAEVEEYAARHTLEVVDKSAIDDFLGTLIRRFYRLAYLQQFLVGVVAALGIITALLISVLQRQRELGLLRAVGATQSQVLKTVLAEAILMGIIGTMMGFLVGLPMEWYVLRVVQLEESGFVFDVLIPWKAMIGIGIGAMIVAVVAGILPAIRAVRLKITEAIAYE